MHTNVHTGGGKSAIEECLAGALTELGTKHIIWRMNPTVCVCMCAPVCGDRVYTYCVCARVRVRVCVCVRIRVRVCVLILWGVYTHLSVVFMLRAPVGVKVLLSVRTRDRTQHLANLS